MESIAQSPGFPEFVDEFYLIEPRIARKPWIRDRAQNTQPA